MPLTGSEARRPQQVGVGGGDDGGRQLDPLAGLCAPRGSLPFSLGWPEEAWRWKREGGAEGDYGEGLKTFPQPTSRNAGN